MPLGRAAPRVWSTWAQLPITDSILRCCARSADVLKTLCYFNGRFRVGGYKCSFVSARGCLESVQAAEIAKCFTQIQQLKFSNRSLRGECSHPLNDVPWRVFTLWHRVQVRWHVLKGYSRVGTGIRIFCTEERSQMKNRERAMQILRTKLFDMELQKQQAEQRERRKDQVSFQQGPSHHTRVFPYPFWTRHPGLSPSLHVMFTERHR